MRTCPICLKEYINNRSDQVYCSQRCKQLNHKRKQSEERSQATTTTKAKDSKPAIYSKKALAQEYRLKELEIETNYKIKLAELEERRRIQELTRLELEAAKQQQVEQQKLELLAAEEEKKILPIKNAILDVLDEAIENSEEVIEEEDLEQLIDETNSVRKQLRTYLIHKGEDYQNHHLDRVLTTLLNELKAIRKDKDCYVEDGVLLDFGKSYIKELKTLQKRIMNG